MSQKYLLSCSCGKTVPIETSQAGGNVLCECGLTLKIPSLLQIKKLPLAGSSEQSASAENGRKRTSPANSSSAATGIFLIGSISTLAAVGLCLYTVLWTYPKPEDVLKKQVYYRFGEKIAVQDSNPLPFSEGTFFVVSDEMIDSFNPIDAMRYWEIVKQGPAMSMNFRENFETLKDYYYLRCAGSGILILIAVGILISSFFLGQNKTVGTRQGTNWGK